MLWINMCLQMLNVYDKVSMFLFFIYSDLYLYDQQEDISRIYSKIKECLFIDKVINTIDNLNEIEQ